MRLAGAENGSTAASRRREPRTADARGGVAGPPHALGWPARERSLGSWWLVSIVLASGCIAGFRGQAAYHWRLDASRQGGGEAAERPARLEVRGLEAVDGELRFQFDVRPGRITLTMRNGTNQPLELVTERASHLDAAGEIRALLVASSPWEGTAACIVQPDSRVLLYLWPRPWMRTGHDGKPATWRSDSPLDGGMVAGGSSAREVMDAGRRDVGRSFTVVLPVRVGQEPRLYRFRFTVDDVSTEVIGWA